MRTLEDEDRDDTAKQLAQASENIDFTSKRIETMLREWEQNQRWQLNKIRGDVEAISKMVAWVGIAVFIAVILYVKRAMDW